MSFEMVPIYIFSLFF